MRKLINLLYDRGTGRILRTFEDIKNEKAELRQEIWDLKHPRDAQGNFTTGENDMWWIKWSEKYGLNRRT
jgi:hypothetical protein